MSDNFLAWKKNAFHGLFPATGRHLPSTFVSPTILPASVHVVSCLEGNNMILGGCLKSN